MLLHLAVEFQHRNGQTIKRSILLCKYIVIELSFGIKFSQHLLEVLPYFRTSYKNYRLITTNYNSRTNLQEIDVRLSNFCFLDANCLVVGESQGSFRRLTGRFPVKSPRPEGDSQTTDTYHCTNS